jgi:hypothetical protein
MQKGSLDSHEMWTKRLPHGGNVVGIIGCTSCGQAKHQHRAEIGLKNLESRYCHLPPMHVINQTF